MTIHHPHRPRRNSKGLDMHTHFRADTLVVALDGVLTLEAATDKRPAEPSGSPFPLPARGRAKHCPENQEIKMPHSAEARGWGGSRAGAGRPALNNVMPLLIAGLRWYVLAIHVPSWRQVVKAIEDGDTRPGFPQRRPFEFFHPTCRIMRRRVQQGRKVKVPVESPMVPGYVFARFDVADPSWGQLSALDGVHTVLRGASGQPLPASDAEIERLRKKAARDAKLNPDAMPPRQTGDEVIVADGPFTGHKGAVVHCDGFTTAVHGIVAFGRVLTMQFSWGDLRGENDGRLSKD